jgi:SAM-dependent methyltransferase
MNDSGIVNTTAFAGLASVYARFRPTYPAPIFDAFVERVRSSRGLDALRRPLVADVGCGTGISSALLVAAGCDVVAIDPNEDMLREATARLDASATCRMGRAEATGLADRSVDAILVAQAFHWCDPGASLAEFARVLRPNGVCGLVWNIRVADGGITDRYNDIVVQLATNLDPSTRSGRAELARPLVESPLFRDAEVVAIDNPQILDEEGIVGRATSASYFPKQEPERSERLAQLRAAFRAHAVDGRIALRQVAECTSAVVR